MRKVCGSWIPNIWFLLLTLNTGPKFCPWFLQVSLGKLLLKTGSTWYQHVRFLCFFFMFFTDLELWRKIHFLGRKLLFQGRIAVVGEGDSCWIWHMEQELILSHHPYHYTPYFYTLQYPYIVHFVIDIASKSKGRNNWYS